MFAGFNMIKPVLMNNLELDDFEFSQIYLQFWDKMEKANKFLECMIEFRDRDLMDRDVVFLLQDPCPDGGYFENFADLVGKYGVVPKEAMAETASSEEHGHDEPYARAASAEARRRASRHLRGDRLDQADAAGQGEDDGRSLSRAGPASGRAPGRVRLAVQGEGAKDKEEAKDEEKEDARSEGDDEEDDEGRGEAEG